MTPVTSTDTTEIETLETEVKKFADGLPYWGRYLAEKILSGKTISDSDIETSYSYLLEQLGLKPENEKPEIEINYNAENFANHKLDLLLTRLENIKGVNALSENQCIEFSENLTIIYGANGSGKSSYVRLLKKAFLSKAPEDILPNIHVNGESKTVDATFVFNSNTDSITLNYSTDQHSAVFKQFAVFDGKSALKHLTGENNKFEFRPAGLNFFADYTDVVNRVEQKLKSDIESKSSANEFIFWFEGESEIKTLIENLSASTKTEDLSKHTPFLEQDKAEKQVNQKQYDELSVASKQKESEIKKLENIKKRLEENKKKIEILNESFSTNNIDRVKKAITDYIEKQASLKTEGSIKFATSKIDGIGTEEWREFILSAERFAQHQHQNHGNSTYPEQTDNCLLCHQALSDEAQRLITNYWKFIKSDAEQEEKQAKKNLDQLQKDFETLNFNLFSDENSLAAWLNDKYSSFLEGLKQKLEEQRILSESIISSIQNKMADDIGQEIKINVLEYENIDTNIDSLIVTFKEDQQIKELETLLKSIKYLEHKEKLNLRLPLFRKFIDDKIWIKQAGEFNFKRHKQQVTLAEKTLSEKYFNQKYIDKFNEECKNLNGNFDVTIAPIKSSGGTSYRQLNLKGKTPNAILSEGEQKIIAIADFIAEMQLSKVNRGIIFDDPVTSLDETRKSEIAKRLVKESNSKQVIIFTHDLVFIHSLLNHGEDTATISFCHWMEKIDDQVGLVWLHNSPPSEQNYGNVEPAKLYRDKCLKKDCSPEERQILLKQGFAALRTCYEVLVINTLFNKVIQRFDERVRFERLEEVYITEDVKNELLRHFSQCCMYMEGHTHSDKYAYKKPEPKDLNEEIKNYEALKSKIKSLKKQNRP